MTDHPAPRPGGAGGAERPPRVDPPLAAAFAKDPDDERFLADLNARLEAAERAAYRELPERYPTLHVVGAPRSGTTLLYQAVVQALDVGYIDNLTAAFWRAPVTGLRLARKLGVAPAGSFGSEFGRTAGIAEPHEFGYFWNHHLRYPDLAERPPSHEAEVDWDALRTVIVNMAEARGAPIAFKPMLLIWHMEAMARAMPRSCFAWIRREPREVALSLLRMRLALRGSVEEWASLRPARAARERDPYRQVAAQVLLLDGAIAAAAGRLGPDTVMEVRYERLCADPNGVVAEVRELMGGKGHAPARRDAPPLPTFAPGPSRGLEEHAELGGDRRGGGRPMSAPARLAEVLAPLVNNNEPQAEVIELLVADGARVAAGDLLCVLETSKATADVEAPAAGHVGRLRVAVGDLVDAGATICEIFDGPPPADGPAAAADGAAPRLTRKAEALLREAGVTDLSGLPTDRFVTQRDVEELLARRAADAPVALDAAVLAAITPRSLVVFGGGGLGRCVVELVRAAGAADLLGVVDDGLAPGDDVLGVPVLGGSAALPALAAAGLAQAAHAVGGVGRMASRERVARVIADAGLAMPVLVDPSASVSPSAELAAGAQVHVGARVMARARIGENALVNTNAVVSHDCAIGAHSHIAPGALLAGDVAVGPGTLVGMGATVLIGVRVGAGCVIGNGAHVLADVPDGARVGVGQVWTGAA